MSVPPVTVWRNPSRLPEAEGEIVATLGCFDGWHVGHQKILERLRQSAAALSPAGRVVVISFYPHPALVLGKASKVPFITTLHQDRRILAEFGVDHYVLWPFNKRLAQLTAEAFVTAVLVRRLGVRRLVLGADAALGQGRTGDVAELTRILSALGGSCEALPLVEADGQKVSSRVIRETIATGDVERVRRWLGRPFAFDGRVVRGEQRGTALGYPTANLGLTRQILPGRGVYATLAHCAGSSYEAVTNIGFRPTFACEALSVESFLLGYDGPALYGQRLELEFWVRLRDEMKFDSANDLRRQIQSDVAEAQVVLRTRGELSPFR